MEYLIGQRVLLGKREIGTVVSPQNGDKATPEDKVWVFSPAKGYASCYAKHNVEPLPNGQL